VHLKNGYILHGKINDAKSNDAQLVLDYGELGFFRIGRDRVLKTEKNQSTGLAPVGPVATVKPAATSKLVKVQLRQGVLTGDHDPAAELVGHLKKSPDEAYSILDIPQVGTMRIPHEAIANVAPYKPEIGVAPVAASASSIATTHLVTLKNGYKLLGNVLPSRESEPVVIKIGSLGRLILTRDRIEKIEMSAGRFELPPPPESSDTSDAETTPAIDGDSGTAEAKPASGAVEEIIDDVEVVKIEDELENEILVQLHDLGRWRSRDRVRAENALRSVGAPAVPYLYEISRHPFELTRRAVMRLVRDIGEPAGVSLAIEGLLDDDRFVRSLADEALRSLLSADVGYNPRANVRGRLEGQKRWQEYYEKLLVARS
jgi:hypothetical protein